MPLEVVDNEEGELDLQLGTMDKIAIAVVEDNMAATTIETGYKFATPEENMWIFEEIVNFLVPKGFQEHFEH